MKSMREKGVWWTLGLLLVLSAWGNQPAFGAPPVAGGGERFRIEASAEKLIALREKIVEQMLPPESTTNGWSKSRVDPAKLLTFFPALRLRDGFTLRAYQFKEEGNGNGVVWAMPRDAEFPAPADCPRLENHLLKAPKPYDALDDVMEGITGNDSPESYLQASILRRELKDFGALWHGIVWGTHVILDDNPLARPASQEGDPMRTPMTPAGRWKWLEAKPTDWAPSVVFQADRAIVTFYTFSGFDQEGLYRHVDTYRRGNYRPRSEETKIAAGGNGYRF